MLATTACEAQPAGCRPGEFVVAIDVGHSSEVPGSQSAHGKYEFEFNWEFAQLLERRLHEGGFGESFVIEHGDKAPSFEERAAAAVRGAADILISIHHDSVQPRYLETWTIDGETLEYTDKFQGYSVFVSRRNGNAVDSEMFGRLLGLSLLRHGFTPTLHHAEPIKGENRELADEATGVYYFDDLLILHTPDMPSVLLECGVIKNRQEEQFLASPVFQERMLDAVVFAVDGYCDTVARTGN